MRSQQSMAGSIASYLPKLTNSSIRNSQSLTQLSSSLNSALASTYSKIGELKTNLLYSFKHSDLTPLHRKLIQIRQDGPPAHLLGQQYTSQDYYKFLFVFRTTFWFTYRKGIKQIETDNGWGCMIRAVQMLFAEVLKRHLQLKSTVEEQYDIIRHFSEQSDGVLSLSAVCKEGNIDKRWTSALQIFTHFKNIMKRYPSNFTFYFEVYSSGVTFKAEQEMLLPSYPALVSLSNRVSLDLIPQELHEHYFQLMRHPSWVGTIGGLNGQALYILGSYENRVIFLDPHKVQSNEEQLQVQTYSCKEPRGIELSALSPSLSFCYYFKTKKEHLEWISWISKSCEKVYPDIIFEFMSESSKKKIEAQRRNPEGISQLRLDEYKESEREDSKEESLGDYQLELASGQFQNSGDFELLQ